MSETEQAEQAEKETRQIEIIRRIGYERGMRDCSLLEDFFLIRFPDEMNESYIGEWVGRFMSGNPIAYMDILSRKAFLMAIDKRMDKQ